ncbi:MAG: hypothetical protein LBV23_04870, partial [Deltaproteobacteria bacterium]|nr:hypothetical protein [Deltaproteobacteria bacterium]
CELTRSAKEAQRQNPNLVKVMLGGGRVALMPTYNGKYSPQEIVGFIKEGAQLYHKIQKNEFSSYRIGQNPPVVGEREIAKLMWFFQALAASKAYLSANGKNNEAKEFKTGGILVRDPFGNLAHFLNLANNYQRCSDHFPQYQEFFDKRQKKTLNFYAHAVDVFTQDTPYGARSLLYQKIPNSQPAFGASLLYLKFEPHGDRGFSCEETGYSAADILANRELKTTPGFFGALKRFFTNFKESLACIFSRNPDRRTVNAGVHNLERVPNWLVKENRKFIAELKKLFKTNRSLRSIINSLDDDTDELNKNGIYVALLALDSAQRNARMKEDSEAKRDFLERLEQFKSNLLQRVGDFPYYRFGQEVILIEDSLSMDPQIASDTNLEKPASLNLNIKDSSTLFKIHSQLNQALSPNNSRQARLIEATNQSLSSQGLDRLRIFEGIEEDAQPILDTRPQVNLDSPEASQLLTERTDAFLNQLSENPPTNDAVTSLMNREDKADIIASTFNNPATQEGQKKDNLFDIEKQAFPTPPDRIDAALKRIGGSQQFSDSVRSLMNREVMASLTELTNYNLVTQTGRTIEELGFSLGLDYTLIKLPPLPTEENQANGNGPIQFNLEVIGHAEPRSDLVAASGDQPLEGEISPKFRFLITYAPLNGETKAVLERAEINYNINRAELQEA